MQSIIHLPNKVHSLIKPPLLHGTLKERIIDVTKRAFVSTFAKYKLFSTDPQFVEKEFLRDAKKAYNLFFGLTRQRQFAKYQENHDMHFISGKSDCFISKSMANRQAILRKAKHIMLLGDVQARLFGYSYAKIDTGVDVMNYFQIAVMFKNKEVQYLTESLAKI